MYDLQCLPLPPPHAVVSVSNSSLKGLSKEEGTAARGAFSKQAISYGCLLKRPLNMF